MHKQRKKTIFVAIIIVGSILFLEIALYGVYFHRSKSKYSSSIMHYYKSLRRRVLQKQIPQIWESDNTYGYRHRVKSSDRHITNDFNVTYTIENRQRFIPKANKSEGKILFLGCSYTFGYGVEDNETFPYILAAEYWNNYEIENAAVAGWGTSQAFISLQEFLNSESKPSLVIYVMISHHVKRNYIGKHWLTFINTVKTNMVPHFEILNGKLSFLSIVGTEKAQEENEETWGKETLITNAFINEMNQKCLENRIPFIVVLLKDGLFDCWRPSIIANLYQKDIMVVDLSQISMQFFPSDAHPNPQDHKKIAKYIAQALNIKILLNNK